MHRFVAEDLARRIAASRELFSWRFFRGDCHSHTDHSDGVGTVEETAAMAKAAGLDFQFVTDHWGVTQAPECRKYGLWFGQEPVTEAHHMGILGLDFAFVPKKNFLQDMADAEALGALVFVPHPTGWWPRMVYGPEQTKLLEQLPSPFLMEIVNGANNLVTAIDYTDESAIELWDHLLCQGRIVHAMGNTDAHAPHGIGIVWNGVFAPRCDQPSIMESLRVGANFVSEAPLVHLAVGKTGMGKTVRRRGGPLRVTAVDSRGIELVRLIGDGRKLKEWPVRRNATWNAEVEVPARVQRYLRVEVIASDHRRAFSNPIYFEK